MTLVESPVGQHEQTAVQHKPGRTLVGVLTGVSQVRYGTTHKKAGKAVPGMFRCSVNVGQSWDEELVFNDVDRDTGEQSVPFRQLQDKDLVSQVCRFGIVTTSNMNSKYTSDRLLWVDFLGGTLSRGEDIPDEPEWWDTGDSEVSPADGQ